MTYDIFKTMFGRARVLKGLPPYQEQDVRVFYDELKGYEDADIIKAFDISKGNKNYFALADLMETINAEINKRKKPPVKEIYDPENYPTQEEIREFWKNLGKTIKSKEIAKINNQLGEGMK